MTKNKHIPVNSRLDKYAKNLRKNMTDEEKTLWYNYLNKIYPRFHRQKIIGNYIVDFYCPKLRIVIEIDGVQHYQPEHYEKDFVRDEFITGKDITVLRFDNLEVKKDYYTVLYRIASHCELKAKQMGLEISLPKDI